MIMTQSFQVTMHEGSIGENTSLWRKEIYTQYAACNHYKNTKLWKRSEEQSVSFYNNNIIMF